MKITVTKDNVKIEEFDVVHEGEHRVNKCSFSFSEEYTEELVKKAIFTSQNSSIEVAIINNECNIPTEILKARNIVLLGVYAYKVTEDKLDLRYSPSPDAFKVNSGSYIEGTSESEEITPSQFEQYMQALNDGLNKVEESIKKMDSTTSAANDLVEDISQKLENGYFIGPEGPQGVQGVPGKDGVGITTITSGQSSVEADKTITPVTVQKSDGSSESFNVEAKNGIDGQNGKDGKDGVNGQDGLTPSIGENGNWYLGDTDTGKPSRGEIGSTPDLTDYVKNTDYAKDGQGGVISTGNHFRVYSNNGVPYVNSINSEQYSSSGDNIFVGKGTLENIKDYYVGSSQPVQDLTATVTNVQNDQDEGMPKQNTEGTDNTITDALDMNLFALGGDGKSEQVTTTGKNLLPNNITSQIINGVTVTKNDDGSITLNGTATSYFTLKFTDDPIILQPGTYMQSFHPSGSATPTGGIFIRSKDSDDNQIFEYSIVSTISKTLDVETTIVDYSVAVNVGTVIKNITLYPMLELGSTATSYEPYTGGQPSPSPDYPQEINSIEGSLEFACRDRNLIQNNASSQTINDVIFIVKDDGSVIVNGTATSRAILFLFANNENPIKLIPGNYSLKSGKTSGASFLQIEVKNLLGESRYITSSNTPNNNVVINEGDVLVAGYIGVDQGQTATNDHIYPVFQKGATSTKYEPYVEPNKVTFNLNDEKLRSVGDVKDELVVDLSTGDYYKVENVGEVVLDGSTDENWGNVPDGTSKERYTSSIIQNLVYTGTKLCQSNYFKSGTSENYYEDGTIRIAPSGGVSIYDDLFTSMDNFKQWLSTNNTIVNYILKKPTTKKLGTLSAEDLAKLKTFKGYNNVTVNTNLGLMNIRFTYGLDIKKYVDNKIAELSAQLIKGE